MSTAGAGMAYVIHRAEATWAISRAVPQLLRGALTEQHAADPRQTWSTYSVPSGGEPRSMGIYQRWSDPGRVIIAEEVLHLTTSTAEDVVAVVRGSGLAR